MESAFQGRLRWGLGGARDGAYITSYQDGPWILGGRAIAASTWLRDCWSAEAATARDNRYRRHHEIAEIE